MAEQAAQISKEPVMVVNRDPRVRQYVIVSKTTQGAIAHRVIPLRPGANILDRPTYDAVRVELDFDVQRDNVYVLTKSISSLPLMEACRLVEMTADRNVLAAFAAVDKRAEVVACLKAKSDAIEKIKSLRTDD
jgi:hypothetical protein